MLKVSATAYLKLGRHLEEISVILLLIKDNLKAYDEERSNLREAMRAIHRHASILKLETTEEVFSEWLEHDKLPETMREWQLMTDVVTKELSRKLFLFVPSHVSKYYEWDGILSKEAATAFPTAYRQLVEAGSCIAAGRHVACVFHSMLAAETGVRVFGTPSVFN